MAVETAVLAASDVQTRPDGAERGAIEVPVVAGRFAQRAAETVAAVRSARIQLRPALVSQQVARDREKPGGGRLRVAQQRIDIPRDPLSERGVFGDELHAEAVSSRARPGFRRAGTVEDLRLHRKGRVAVGQLERDRHQCSDRELTVRADEHASDAEARRLVHARPVAVGKGDAK